MSSALLDDLADCPGQSPEGPSAEDSGSPECIETEPCKVLVFDGRESGLEDLHPTGETEPSLTDDGPIALLNARTVGNGLVARALGDADPVEPNESPRTAENAAPRERVSEQRPLTGVHADLTSVVTEVSNRTAFYAGARPDLTEERLERVRFLGTAGDARPGIGIREESVRALEHAARPSAVRESFSRTLVHALSVHRHELATRTARRAGFCVRVRPPERSAPVHAVPALWVAKRSRRALGDALSLLRVESTWAGVQGQCFVVNQKSGYSRFFGRHFDVVTCVVDVSGHRMCLRSRESLWTAEKLLYWRTALVSGASAQIIARRAAGDALAALDERPCRTRIHAPSTVSKESCRTVSETCVLVAERTFPAHTHALPRLRVCQQRRVAALHAESVLAQKMFRTRADASKELPVE